MLRSISWTQFISFLLAAAAVYYLYVVGRYYRKEVIDFFLRRKKDGKTQKEQGGTVAAGGLAAGTVVSSGGTASLRPQPLDLSALLLKKEGPGVGKRGAALITGDEVSTQEDLPDLFENRGTESGQRAEQTPELFKAMEKAITLVKGTVSLGRMEDLSREELMDRLTEVLSGYHHLKGTPYQDGINNFLTRTCSSNFSLLLGEDELEVLWS